MNVYFDPIGLGVLISPGVGRDTRNVEAKVLVQKNFFNDRLRAVMNFGGDIGTERSDAAWSDVSALTFDAGVAYNITWSWSAALEFNAEHDFDGLLLNGRATPTASTFFFGPDNSICRPSLDGIFRSTGSVAMGERCDAYGGRTGPWLFIGCRAVSPQSAHHQGFLTGRHGR